MSLETPKISVLCAGRLYCDLVFTDLPKLPTLGTETFSQGLSLHAGGGAFITAAAFRALGWPASLAAVLPAAPFDAIVRADIAAASVDDALCEACDQGLAPQITVAMAQGNDRAFLSHKVGKSIPSLETLQGGWGHLHIGELRSLIENPQLAKIAKAAGMTTSLDCGWDDDLLSKGGKLVDIISQVDVFLPNETEFDCLHRSGLPEACGPLIVVKCGANGARALTADGWVMASANPVDVIDATGAGDAFNGGFLTGWLSGYPIERCLAIGNLCGGATVQQAGGLSGLSKLKAEIATASANVGI